MNEEGYEASQQEQRNTKVLKLVKTDRELVEELREYVDAMIAKAAELRARNMVMNVSLDNGATTGKVALQAFRVDKIMDEYYSEEVKAQRAPR